MSWRLNLEDHGHAEQADEWRGQLGLGLPMGASRQMGGETGRTRTQSVPEADQDTAVIPDVTQLREDEH